MKFQGAVVKEQGVTFAIVVVKPQILASPIQSETATKKFATVFPGVPIILMAQDGRGIATYSGRKDIVRFLANLRISQIPWKEYTLTW